jgi:hypothetical protein
MQNWIAKYKLYLAGAVVGAVAGFIYWKYVGCVTGSCAITSNPWKSTMYFALMGSLLFGLFENQKKETDTR